MNGWRLKSALLSLAILALVGCGSMGMAGFAGSSIPLDVSAVKDDAAAAEGKNVMITGKPEQGGAGQTWIVKKIEVVNQ
jgi:hypothetical protein